MKCKRPAHLTVSLETELGLDLKSLLSGGNALKDQDKISCFHTCQQKEFTLSPAELLVLTRSSAGEWRDAQALAQDCDIPLETVLGMVDRGLLIDDQEGGRAILEKESRLSDTHWAPQAAYFHYSTKWSKRVGYEDAPRTPEAAHEFVECGPQLFEKHQAIFGDIPPHFHEPAAGQRLELPLDTTQTPLTELMLRRRTTRFFDNSRPLDQDRLFTLLRYVYGAHAYARLSSDLIALKKTSPSGGALHPIEVYPLIVNVEGLDTGLYHYHVGDHALDQMAVMSQDKARELIDELSAKQSYLTSAQVVFFYTARFKRNFWKYAKHTKAYKALLLDMAHLSQSLYLLCTELGLGAFFTAACNETEIEELLGLDPLVEGVLGLNGCGIPVPSGEDTLEFPGEPYIPRQTKI